MLTLTAKLNGALIAKGVTLDPLRIEEALLEGYLDASTAEQVRIRQADEDERQLIIQCALIYCQERGWVERPRGAKN